MSAIVSYARIGDVEKAVGRGVDVVLQRVVFAEQAAIKIVEIDVHLARYIGAYVVAFERVERLSFLGKTHQRNLGIPHQIVVLGTSAKFQRAHPTTFGLLFQLDVDGWIFREDHIL